MTTQTQPTPAAKPANGSKPPVPPTAVDAAKPTNGATDAKAADAKPTNGEAVEGTKTRVARKVYIVTEAKEFKNKAEAEKYLNGEDAPKEFTVIVGSRIDQKKKVSLR